MSSSCLNFSTSELSPSENAILAFFNNLYNCDFSVDSLQALNDLSSGHLQKTLSEKAYNFIYSNFFSSLSLEEKFWLSNSLDDSASWFSSPPLKNKGLWMPNATFQMSVLHRIREDLFPESARCFTGNNRVSIVDPKGRHSTGCPVGGGTHRRHQLVTSAIYSIATEAGLHPRLEPLHLTQTGKRPADIFIPIWMHTAQPAAFDISVVAPTRNNIPISAESDYAYALEEAFKAKCVTHAQGCEDAGITFIPLIFSTSGSVHPKSMQALRYIADARSLRLNIPVSRGRAELMQRISVAIHTGNSNCFLNHGFLSNGVVDYLDICLQLKMLDWFTRRILKWTIH
jgi:hypothetical protein